MMNRRGFLQACLASATAPYVVTTAGVLMPVRGVLMPGRTIVLPDYFTDQDAWIIVGEDRIIQPAHAKNLADAMRQTLEIRERYWRNMLP